MLDNKKLLMFAGSSSGGLSVYQQIDRLADNIRAKYPDLSIVGVPDGGFWVNNNVRSWELSSLAEFLST